MSCVEVLRRRGLGEPTRARLHVLPLRPTPRSPGQARAFADSLDLPLGPDERAVLLLLTSELVSNGVLHARTDLEYGVAVVGDLVLVTVTDGSRLLPERRPYATTTDGRGIALVADLAGEWGTEVLEDGKVVWFTLRAVPAARDATGAVRTRTA